MRVVIFAESDFEPITVVDLPPLVVDLLKANDRVSVPVMEPFTFMPLQERFEPPRLRVVVLRPVVIRNPKWLEDRFIIVTYDEESALLLKSVFLAGQRAALQDTKQSAFARGFIHALQGLGC